MILRLLRTRRQLRQARAERIRRSADQFIAAWNNDLHAAFWRAHDRARDPAMPKAERAIWRALAGEINGRRPKPPGRGDTATRMVFRDRRG